MMTKTLFYTAFLLLNLGFGEVWMQKSGLFGLPDWMVYANQGAIRNQPISPDLIQAMGFLPEMGVQMRVFSGGQDASGPRRTGSHRHDHGKSADVLFYKDGRKLDWANDADRAIFSQIVQRAKANGVTGFGAGPGYMQPGSMHIGYGAPAVWGAGGRGANAPDWLRAAYNGAPMPRTAPQPTIAAREPSPPVSQQSPIPIPASAPPQQMRPSIMDFLPKGNGKPHSAYKRQMMNAADKGIAPTAVARMLKLLA